MKFEEMESISAFQSETTTTLQMEMGVIRSENMRSDMPELEDLHQVVILVLFCISLRPLDRSEKTTP
jgi:hypothetical protein